MIGNKQRCLIAIFLLCAKMDITYATSQPTSSKNSTFFTNLSSLPLVSTLSIGPISENNGNSQTFYLAPQIEKTYTVNRDAQTLAQGELFLGMQKKLPYQLEGQLGLAAAITSSARLSGDIWDDAAPAFDNYQYRYQLYHRHVAVKGKLLLDRDYPVIPWISASIGIGFNAASGFINTPTLPEVVASSNFRNHTTSTFTYTLGVGVQRQLCKNWQVGIGYEFADWGKSRLATAPGQTMGQGLALSHFYTSGLLANLTWIN